MRRPAQLLASSVARGLVSLESALGLRSQDWWDDELEDALFGIETLRELEIRVDHLELSKCLFATGYSIVEAAEVAVAALRFVGCPAYLSTLEWAA